MTHVSSVPRPLVLAVGGRSPEVDPSAFVAPTATLLGAVHLGPRCGVWYGAVLRADSDRIVVGTETNLQDGVIVHCDAGIPALLGDRITVGHGAVVHGAVVEDDCLIGMRATLLNGVRIGAGSLVAAGAVVREGTHVPPGHLVSGVPAVVKRELHESEQAMIAKGCAQYVELARIHSEAATS